MRLRGLGLLGGCAVLATLVLAGCGGQKMLALELDPQNPNTCGGSEPSALWIRIYQLRSDQAFQRASFGDLWSDDPEVLEQELIGEPILTTVDPLRRTTLDAVKLQRGAAFIGVVGNFCQRESSGWKDVLPVRSEDKASYRIEVRESHLSISPDRS